jgi:hypothetical protein
MRTFVAVSAVSGAILLAISCASFSEGDGADPALPNDASTANPDGGTPGEASTCQGGRDAGNACGSAFCVKGQTCCLDQTPVCVDVADCGALQVNCASPSECPFARVCCQLGGDTVATECKLACAFGTPLCEKDSDCKAGEHCRGPDPSRQIAYFHCAECPDR